MVEEVGPHRLAVLPAALTAAASEPDGLVRDRRAALPLATILPVLGAEPFHYPGTHHERRGYPLHRGRTFLGHLAVYEPALPSFLDLLESLGRNPASLLHLLETLPPAVLAAMGRLLPARLAERSTGTVEL